MNENETCPIMEMTFGRRKELVEIADGIIDKLLREGVQPHEFCFIRRAAEMLAPENRGGRDR